VSKVTKEEKISPFYLQGRLVGFVGDFGEKPKRLRVAVAEGELYIKLAKELRYSLREVLQPGDWIEIFGEKKLKPKTGELKLKAFQVKLATPVRQQSLKEPGTGDKRNFPEGLSTSPSFTQSPIPNPESFNQSPVAVPKTKACVMVCQKSSCRKRGADAVCHAVTESLREHGLEEQVAIKGTGCMKQCKQGPCVVFMPDKSRYIKVEPQQIDRLVEKHFAAKLKPEGSKPELSPIA
jgi:(2Fe-2S) ferredoxin